MTVVDAAKFGSRAAIATVALCVVALSVGDAAAQYYPRNTYGGGYRAAPMPDDDDDQVGPPPSIYGRPPGLVPNSRAGDQSSYPYDSRYRPAPDPRFGDVDPDGPPPPYRTAPNYDRAPAGVYGARPGDGTLRPPAVLDQRQSPADLGSNQNPMDLTPNGPVRSGSANVASLPPEDQPEEGEIKELPPQLRRQLVNYQTVEPAGTIVIDTPNTYLYLVLGNGKALRYGIGVGREGFTWSGRERVTKMAEWPDWIPPKEMIERQPYLPRFMAGGPSNPLGARALYLGNSVYRIHGTNQPSTIGSSVSSGCIRLTNEDVEDLYRRVQVGTRVVVLPSPTSSAALAPGIERRDPTDRTR
jgi:lipoprotein-anchoring transpeptidase ErfK/SrfK